MNLELSTRCGKPLSTLTRWLALSLALSVAGLWSGAASAAVTNIAQTPLLSIDGTGTVKPNLMLLFDNSGSMTSPYTPDYVKSSLCRNSGSTLVVGITTCVTGQPPFMSADFNKQYYNPAILYSPPVYSDGTSYPSMTAGNSSNWTSVKTDAYGKLNQNMAEATETTTNLVGGFPDLKFCRSSSSSTCVNNTAYAYPNETYPSAVSIVGAPYYYTINAGEYCSDATLTVCTTRTTPTTGFTFPAKVRWCTTRALTTCQAKRVSPYNYPRYSTATGSDSPFVRTNIVSSVNSYPKVLARTDCAGATCTYVEEMTNFANWYTYYKTRMQMMKTSVGLAFNPLTSSYRVGFFKLSTAAAGNGTVDMLPAPFDATARATWYSNLYNVSTSGSTPLRSSLDNAGKVFANKSPYNQAVGNEVVTAPCQQNFLILTTDGYWNLGSSSTVESNDESEQADRFCTKANGCVDTRVQGAKESLADVALYWYNGGTNTGTISLRPDIDPMDQKGQVAAADGENKHLHMNTFTLGLGVDGIMTYDKNYDQGGGTVGGDFYNLINSVATGCPWNSNGAYVWPNPNTGTADTDSSNVQERVDDLWHAAVSGHGKYFSASTPGEVVDGLGEAIAKLQTKPGAASASTSSNPVVTQEDNDLFQGSFATVRWTGEVTDYLIDTATGVVATTKLFSTDTEVGKQTAAATDARSIYMFNDAGTTLKAFKYASMTTTEKAWFLNRCTALAQCATLTAANKVIVNDGTSLVDYLRGQQQYANDTVFRAYYTPPGVAGQPTPVPIVLGDIAGSKTVYLSGPRKSYPDIPPDPLRPYLGYQTYKNRLVNAGSPKPGVVFAAANDGMLHAFYAPTSGQAASVTAIAGKEWGKEIWAYVPRITMKKLPALASTTYGSNHIFTADGSPEVADVRNAAGEWKTVLVAGLNAGGRGYYALDVTDPENPKQLWELCADAAICAKHDDDLGLSYGNPQFGKYNGQWVVYLTSGYNNTSGVDGVNTGSGVGYLYVVNVFTGAVIQKISTGAGSTTTPSGFAKITAITLNPAFDAVTTYVYGGDNLGNMFRFDMGNNGARITMGTTSATQPITTRPEVTTCDYSVTDASNVTTTSNERVVLFGTGRLLDLPDLTDTSVQSLYAVVDRNSNTGSGNFRAASSRLTKSTLNAGSVAGTSTITTPALVPANQYYGWYLDLTLKSGERVNVDPKVVSNVGVFVTNVPTTGDACSVGGKSYVYQLNACYATSVRTDGLVGEQLAETADGGFGIIMLPDGTYKLIGTLADGSTVTKDITVPVEQPAHKAGWRRVAD